MLWMAQGKVLAVDYGLKNVGLACSDELRVTVTPLPSIPNRARGDLVGRLLLLAQQHGASEIVLGLPLNMDGSAGPAVASVERLMEALRAEAKLTVSAMDERLSTLEAQELWKAMTARQQKRYRTVDSVAAALILERYIKEA
jgi:putative holliday junction resolvase